MKKHFVRLTALLLAASMLAACGSNSANTGSTETTSAKAADVSALEYPVTPDELGSGEVKWSEEKTADGWMKVTNDGGETLGYSPDSGVTLIQVDGYAFKDLNKNGVLDAYEDWRLDNKTRAAALAGMMTGEEIAPLLTHGGWGSFGTELDDATIEYLDNGGRSGLTRSSAGEGNTKTAVVWTNALQAYAEGNGQYGIPVSISVDPGNVNSIIDQLSLGATMDTELAHDIGRTVSDIYRSVGITMLLGPQVDLTTPVFDRANGTYSEDPALTRDLAAAFIDGLQSTYDENGADLGWGYGSIVSVVKHFAGAGASEGGRNDHIDTGKYTVFENNNFATSLIPFFDGAFNLDGKTEAAGGVMPNYAISYSADGSLGELVVGAYSEFKLNLLRENGYDGFVLTDWGIVEDGTIIWGVEDLTVPERFATLFMIGVDQVGGCDNTEGALAGYDVLVEWRGEEAALETMREHARRLFEMQMNVELFDNPYINTEKAVASIYTDELGEYAVETQKQSIIMLKNADNTIHEKDESAGKPTVYIPYAVLKTGGDPRHGYIYSAVPMMDIEVASEYFNVVTDSVGDPSGVDYNGNPIHTADDIIRASAADIAKCDYAVLNMDAPYVTSTYDAESGKWLPATIQYEQYTADSESVKKESLAGDMIKKEIDTPYGVVTEDAVENRSYYGNTAALPGNYNCLETLKYVASAVPESCKIITAFNCGRAMVFSEVEPYADAIFVYYGNFISTEALLSVISGEFEPNGLLPMQEPASMEVVEAQAVDTPRDMECYVDSEGNTYDFAFGLNWSGVISDERTAKYQVAPLTEPAAQPVNG